MILHRVPYATEQLNVWNCVPVRPVVLVAGGHGGLFPLPCGKGWRKVQPRVCLSLIVIASVDRSLDEHE